MNITSYTYDELKAHIANVLTLGGVTASAEKVPSLFIRGGAIDTESTTITHTDDKGNTVIDACFCYTFQLGIGKDYAIYRTKDEFIAALRAVVDAVTLINELSGNDVKFILWCANLCHEWSFLKHDINRAFNITKVFAKSARDVLLIQLEKCVEIREALGLFGRSLDDISKHWVTNNRKLTGTFDYDLVRTWKTPLTKTEQAYMINDVLSLTEMHENAIRYYTQENGVCVLPYTSSGFVRLKLKNAIRDNAYLSAKLDNHNYKYDKQIKSNIELLKWENSHSVVNSYQWKICRNYSYAGGLCGSNIDYVGKILNNVVCADVTSDYPAQMVQQRFPCGRLRRVNVRKYDEIVKQGKPYFILIKIQKMCSKSSHAVFSQHKIINACEESFIRLYGYPRKMVIYNGKVKRGENIIACWNDVDLAAYKEIYDLKYGILDMWVFDGYGRAPEWLLQSMESDYINKAQLKASGQQNTQDYTEAKRNVNTYYGVLATRSTDSFDDLDIDLNFVPKKDKSFYDISHEMWLNPYIAFWVTSYARALLMHFISRYPKAIVQYDTDSLYYIKSKGKELESALHEYNDIIKRRNRIHYKGENARIFETLGTWDFDDVYKRFLPLGAKKYIKEDKDGIHTVIAGLPKNAIPSEIETRHIHEPLTYYNPVVRYTKDMPVDIVIEHIFAHKFASYYSDESKEREIVVTDYQGNTAFQPISSYHAILPIDFTLALGADFLKQILHKR